MAHVAKHGLAASGHMFKHYERAKDENGEYIKFSNQSIDPSYTHLNYNLAPDRKVNQGNFVRQRCSEVRMQKRKDVNVMCSWIVTAPKDLPLEEIDVFFRATYNFLAARYGGEQNVVSAYVHMDETTPHIHFAFVPVVEDKKRGGFKVSAKEAITRADLQRFHGELSVFLAAELGHEVAVLNEATKDGNKTIAELKQASLAHDIKTEEHTLVELRKTREETSGNVDALSAQKNALEGEIRGLTAKGAEWRSSLTKESKITSVGEEVKPILGATYIKCQPDDFAELKKAALGNFALAIRAQVAEERAAELRKRLNEAERRASHSWDAQKDLAAQLADANKELGTASRQADRRGAFIEEKGLADEYRVWVAAAQERERKQRARERSRGMGR